jgi:MOSC domain-containing protein YiiM
MKLIAVNVGMPQTVTWKGKSVTTGIFKYPVSDRVRVRALNIEGDGQADLTVHGGIDKAVYAYPIEHYPYWQKELPGVDLPWGAFGENLSVEGLSETTVCIGDRLRIGTAELLVTQPRFPCFKLNLKFDRDDMMQRFLSSGLSGIYFAVAKEGDIGVGDPIEVISQDEHQISLADIVRIYRRAADRDLVQRAVRVPALAEGLRERFQQQLDRSAD